MVASEQHSKRPHVSASVLVAYRSASPLTPFLARLDPARALVCIRQGLHRFARCSPHARGAPPISAAPGSKTFYLSLHEQEPEQVQGTLVGTETDVSTLGLF